MPRPYRVTTPDPRLATSRTLTKADRVCLAVIMLIASGVRLFGLSWPTSVVFDEVHFGGFARKYIIGRFFFDVHPPLAKMLFAVAGYAAGFRGDFEFTNIGDDYILPKVPYIGMRLFPSIMGLFTIALCYSTLRAAGCRTLIASFGSLLLTFENTHATESRYILLDSPLLFFISITAYGFVKFQNEVPFTGNWYKFLLLTGLGLGATVSSKWVGLFTIAWVGSLTLWQLWWLIGDRSISLPTFGKHFGARAVCLVGVPLAFYVSMFYLHFMCVDNHGSGADFMPREFLSTLKHNDLPRDVPADVYFGSSISIRHVTTNGGWLHSHNSSYETGSNQQQITLYPHHDENNMWTVENATENWNPENLTVPVQLKDGDLIRLGHPSTGKRLHSHDIRAPVTSHDYVNEVSGYGFEGFEGDANDNWRIKILKEYSHGEGKEKVQALRTYFQLEHQLTGCLLYSKGNQLPAWGFEQNEVACIRGGSKANTRWYIEHNRNSEVENPELINYEKPSFLSNFINLNKAMWSVNKGLTATHHWESRPLDWLYLDRGINMWTRDHRQVYLIGNLPVYLTITATIVFFLLFKAVQIIFWQRFSTRPLRDGLPEPIKKASDVSVVNASAFSLFDQQYTVFMLGWAFHYFPSFLMARQLFLHHYLASVYFGVLMISQVFEFLVAVFPIRIVSKVITVLFLTAAIVFYLWYAPLVYGTRWSKEQCLAARFNSMDFDCNSFLDTNEQYDEFDVTVAESIGSARLGLTPTATETATQTAIATDQAQPEEEAVEPVVQEQVVIADVADDAGNIPVNVEDPALEEKTEL